MSNKGDKGKVGLGRRVRAGLRRPWRVPPYLWHELHASQGRPQPGSKGRVPFNFEQVSSYYIVDGAALPHFSARLFAEVGLLNEAIGDLHARRSLEVGCGYGRLSPWIAKHSDSHFGIDPEAKFIKVCKELYPSMEFRAGSAQHIPYPDDYFDMVVTWTVLQHVPPDGITAAVEEIKRVCSPRSVLIVTEGVGSLQNERYWERTLDEWKKLLQPWDLTWSTERKLERTFPGYAGEVMRFERKLGP